MVVFLKLFFSYEGGIEEHKDVLSNIYDGVKGRVQLISMAKDKVHILSKKQIREQNQVLGKLRLWQMVEQINKFKEDGT